MKDDMTKSAIFADDGHKQDVLPLDFAAEEKAKNNKKDSPAKAKTGADEPQKKVEAVEPPPPVSQMQQVNKPLFEKKVETVEPSPAASGPMQQVNKPLFQKFESDFDDGNAPAMPAFRSAIYPAGYARQMETAAAESRERPMTASVPAAKSAAVMEAETSTVRKTPEIVERSQPERAAAAIQEKKMAPGHRQKNIDIDVFFGKMLYEARNRLNLSIAQVAQETKIQKEYIEALESEDFNRLPPMVYVCAYVRKLSALYKIEQSRTEEVLEVLKKNLEVSLSEEIIAHLDIDREHSPESEHKVRNLYWMAAVAVLLFIGLVSIAVLMLMAPNNQDKKQTAAATVQPNSPASTVPAAVPAAPAAAFDPARLESLKARQTIPMSELSPRH
ncbi:MAG: helix-turn-helix domain-containing protein [Victivallaceae bacterium]|jgi:transcriptional regulator with XRE-family HTH domain